MRLAGDNALYTVPLPVIRNARLGLALRRKSARGNDIKHGFDVASALISGRITKQTLFKMALFFNEQSQDRTATKEQLLLFGGETGLKFVIGLKNELL
jgi:hypothetical protein